MRSASRLRALTRMDPHLSFLLTHAPHVLPHLSDLHLCYTHATRSLLSSRARLASAAFSRLDLGSPRGCTLVGLHHVLSLGSLRIIICASFCAVHHIALVLVHSYRSPRGLLRITALPAHSSRCLARYTFTWIIVYTRGYQDLCAWFRFRYSFRPLASSGSLASSFG